MNGTAANILLADIGVWGVAAIAAVWSLVYFTKVKVSSPAVPRKAAESGRETQAEASPAPDADETAPIPLRGAS